MRAKAQRHDLPHVLSRYDQKEEISNNDRNSRNYCERFFLGSYNQGQKIEFDESPVGFKTVLFRKRDIIMIFEHGEEVKFT